MFSHMGSPDPRGERDGEKARGEMLDEIREKIGVETYKKIIAKLANKEAGGLTQEEQAIIEEIKKSFN